MAFDESPIWGVADNSEEKSERFTSPSSLDLVHRLRRVSDCVLVGRGTVVRDDCTLTVRRVPLLRNDVTGETNTQPVRVVIDPKLRLLETNENEEEYQYALLKDGLPTILYHSSIQKGNSEKINSVCNPNEHLTLVNLSNNKSTHSTISCRDILCDLGTRNIHHIMVEGGPMTALSFLQEKTVDRAIIIKAPVTFVEPVLSNMSEQTLIGAGLEKLGSKDSEGDIVEYWSRPGLPWPKIITSDDGSDEVEDDLWSWP